MVVWRSPYIHNAKHCIIIIWFVGSVLLNSALYFPSLVIRFLLNYICRSREGLNSPTSYLIQSISRPKTRRLLLFSVLKTHPSYNGIPLALYSITSTPMTAERRPANIVGWTIPVCQFLFGIVCDNCRNFTLGARFRNWIWLTVKDQQRRLCNVSFQRSPWFRRFPQTSSNSKKWPSKWERRCSDPLGKDSMGKSLIGLAKDVCSKERSTHRT